MNNTLFSGDSTVSLEMISAQVNDPIVGQVTSRFEKIIDLVKNDNVYKGLSSSKLLENKVIAKLFEEIDELTYERFGIQIKHVSDDYGNYGILPLPPERVSSISHNALGNYSIFRMYKDMYDKDDGTIKDSSQIKDYNKDAVDIMVNGLSSLEAIEKALNTKGIKIDNKKATISGLSKDYIVFVSVNLKFIVDSDVTASEMCGIYLHEMGHGYTHISYAYRASYNTSVLMDSFKEDIDSKGAKVLEMKYKKLGGKSKDFPTSPVTQEENTKAVTMIIDKYIESVYGFNSETHSFTDSEQLADQFATRFGLGVDLARGLDKMNKKYDSILYTNPLDVIITFESIKMVLLIATTSGLITAILAGMLFFMFVKIVTGVLLALITGAEYGESTYDQNKERLNRIYLDAVRQLRKSDVDKKYKKELVSQVDEINKIKDTYEDSISMSTLFVKMFSFNLSEKASNKEIEQQLEKLMENKLYVSMARLETLLKGY